MGVYRAYFNKPINCVECEYGASNGKTYTWCMELGIKVDGLKQTPTDCPLIEIVTCGECNRSGTDGENTFCMWLGALRKPTDFCSYGERDEDFDPYQGERDRDENGEIY